MVKCSQIYYWFLIHFYINPLQNNLNTITFQLQTVMGYLLFLSQVFFLVIIAIWARAAGPRFRLDQMLSMTWKDIFIYLMNETLLIIFHRLYSLRT